MYNIYIYIYNIYIWCMVFVLLLNIFLFLVNQESALKISCWGDFLPRNQISKEKKLYNEKKKLGQPSILRKF